jgi:hypothetical protein
MLRTSLIVLIVSIIGILGFYQMALVNAFSESTITLLSSQNPSTFGQIVTFTANVSPITATGTVIFYDTSTSPSTTLGTGTISGGTATFSTSSLSVGSHKIGANYFGDSSDSTSSSTVLIETVNQISSNQQTVGSPQLTQPQIISIDTEPRVANVLIDNTLYLPSQMPLQFNWNVGSRHTIDLVDTTIQTGVGSRYIFDTWSDQSNDPVKTVTVKNVISLRAIFKVQNYLKVNSDFGKVKGEDWYDKGATAEISILQNKIIDKDNLRQHIFDGWSDGNNKKSIKNSIIVDSPMTINANWKDQYYLQLTSSIVGISIPGSGWYDKGAQVPLFVDNQSPISKDTKNVFDKWVLKGDNPSTIDKPDSNVATLTLNGPQIVEADWKKSYYVSVTSPHADTTGSGFYPEGTTANISVSTTEITTSDQQHKLVFSGWSGDTGGLGQTSNVIVDKPLTIVANWKDQYYLSVTSNQGTPSGSGWYDNGQVASISITSPTAPPGVWVRYVFDGWSDGNLGKNRDSSFVMTGSKTVSAVWRDDYTPAVMNSLIMSAVGGVGLLVYRKTKKKRAGMKAPNKIVPPPIDGDENTVASEVYRAKLRDEYEEFLVGKHQQAKEIQDKENFPPFIPALIKEYSDKILAYYYYKLYNDQRYGERQDWLLLIHQEIRDRFEKILKKDEERQRVVPK